MTAPLTLAGYLGLTIRRLPAMLTVGLFARILVAAPIAAGAWALHTFMLVVLNEGFGDGGTPWAPLLALSGARLVTGTVLWGVAAWLITTLITRALSSGPGRVLADLGRVPGWMVSNVRAAGEPGVAVLAGSFALAELGGALVGNRPLAITLFLGGVLALADGPRGVLLGISRLAWQDLERALFPGVAPHPFHPERLVVLQIGLAFGLLRAAVLPMSPGIGVCGGLALALVAVALLGLSVRRGLGVAVVLLLAAHGLGAEALADDGGWMEAGGSFTGWVVSPGSTAAVLHGLPPAAATFVGVVVGSLPGLFPPIEAPKTTIFGTGTVDDPYRDASAFKVNPDGTISGYPESTGAPIYGTGTAADPYSDAPPPVFDPTPEPPEPPVEPPPPTEPPGPVAPEPPVAPPVPPVAPPVPPVAPPVPPVVPVAPVAPVAPPVPPVAPPVTPPIAPPIAPPAPPIAPPVPPTPPTPPPPPPPLRPAPTPLTPAQQAAKEAETLAAGQTSWSEYLSNVWQGSKKDMGAVANDVRTAGGWVRDQAVETAHDVAGAAKEAWKDPQIIWDTATGTAGDIKDGLKTAGATTWDVGKDIVTHPIDIGYQTVKTTVVDAAQLGGRAAVDIKDMVTDPTRREGLIKNTVGYTNFTNAMDPNVSPTVRVLNYGIGVYKVATIGKTLAAGTTRAVLNQAAGSLASNKAVETYHDAKQAYDAARPVIDACGGGKTVAINMLKAKLSGR